MATHRWPLAFATALACSLAGVIHSQSLDGSAAGGPQGIASQRPREARLIENAGLAEFAPDFDVTPVSALDKAVADETAPVTQLLERGDKSPEMFTRTAVTLAASIAKYPDDADLLFLRATAAVVAKSDDYRAILSDIDAAIRLHATSRYTLGYDLPQIYGFRAKVLILAHDLPSALDDLEKGVRRSLDYTDFVFRTGGVPTDKGDPTEFSKSDLDALVFARPSDYRSYLFRGLFLQHFTFLSEEYFTSAFADLEKASQLNPRSALPVYFRGRLTEGLACCSRAGKSDISGVTGASGGYRERMNLAALDLFKQAAALDATLPDAVFYAAECLFDVKRYADAIPYYDHAIALRPDDARAYYDRGRAETALNDPFGAIDAFSAVIRLARGYGGTHELYESRASAYASLGHYEQAIDDEGRAIGAYIRERFFSWPLSQIRASYPELASISDRDLMEGLREKYHPQWNAADFANDLLNTNNKLMSEFGAPGEFDIANSYATRGDLYLKVQHFRMALRDYGRASVMSSAVDRWRSVLTTPTSEVDLDARTLNLAAPTPSFWLRTLNVTDGSYTEDNDVIDCAGRLYQSRSMVGYARDGTVRFTRDAAKWQTIPPDSVVEFLYGGACRAE